MTEEPIPQLVGKLAVPTIISMLVTAFYNMADTFFVGKIGTSATGAVGIVFSLMAIIQAVGFTFGHGSGNYISRKFGSGDLEDAEKMAATGFVSALIAGALLAVAGLLFLDPLVRLLGATPTIAPHAKAYARYILLGAPYMTASLVLNNQLRFQGSAFYSMLGIATGAVLNIALDPVFIFWLDMGVGGAGLATMISQFVSFCILWVATTRAGNLSLRLRSFAPTRQRYIEIFRGGFPSFCRQSIASLAVIFLNTLAGPYGDAAIAAMSVVGRVSMFVNSAVIGFGQGFQPVCGFNYGAKRYDRVLEAFWFCLKVSVGMLLALSAIGYWYAPQIIAVFRDDAEVIAIGTLALQLQCITFPLMSWVILSNMLLQTIGRSFGATVLALARQGLFFFPALLLFVPMFGILGLQMAQPISDVASLSLSLWMAGTVLRELKRLQNETPFA